MPKQLQNIKVIDNRGTSMNLQVYLANESIPGYVRELGIIWNNEFDGNVDSVNLNGVPYKPAAKNAPDLHTP